MLFVEGFCRKCSRYILINMFAYIQIFSVLGEMIESLNLCCRMILNSTQSFCSLLSADGGPKEDGQTSGLFTSFVDSNWL